MNKKIEQLLDLALTSPMVIDHPDYKEKLIEDARQLNYLTVSSEGNIKLVEGFRKLISKDIDIDLVLAIYSVTGRIFAKLLSPKLDFDVTVATEIVSKSESYKNDKD